MANYKKYSDANKLEIVKQILKLRAEGHSAMHAYQITGISHQIYYYWVSNNAKVIQVVKEFEKREKQEFLEDIRNKAKKALYNGLAPQVVKETESTMIDSPNGKIKKIVVKEKTLPVNASLIQFALANTMPENFTRADREGGVENPTLEQMSLEELAKRKEAIKKEPTGQSMPEE